MKAYLLVLKGHIEQDSKTHNLVKRVNAPSYAHLSNFVKEHNLLPLLQELPLETKYREDIFDIQLTEIRDHEGKLAIAHTINGLYPHVWHEQVEYVQKNTQVQQLVNQAKELNLNTQAVAKRLDIHPDRLHNGGIQEAIELALKDDDPEWIESRLNIPKIPGE